MLVLNHLMSYIFKHFVILILMFASTFSLTAKSNDFICRRGVHFYHGTANEPYYFIGTNLWYGSILGSTGLGGNRYRLCQELDSLQKLGITNLRILAGADAGTRNSLTVEPYLQSSPGEYDEVLLEGLDFLLTEMRKRGMYAVIYLTNSWDWSGGFGFYLKATGHGDSPDAHDSGWGDYVEYVKEFFQDKKAQNLYQNHIRHIVTRVNSLTGCSYTDDPTIMSWQLCNEPRPFGTLEETAFVEWVRSSAALIKSLDKNHMVSTGSEGVIGCNVKYNLCREVHEIPDIDYLTVHIWPANWQWIKDNQLYESLPEVFLKSREYIDMHDSLSVELQKPYVIEEFGYPRDQNFHTPGSPTIARDAFYRFIFEMVVESSKHQGVLAGCNFWGWGGIGRPQNDLWMNGADYLCDPPHEPQGWYSVFSNDITTLHIIKAFKTELLDIR